MSPFSTVSDKPINEFCPMPNCPVPILQKSLDDFKKDTLEMKGDIKELVKQNGAIQALANDIKYIREDIAEIKESNILREQKDSSIQDEISKRLRDIESEEHHKSVYTALSSKVSKKDVMILLSIFTVLIMGFELFTYFIKSVK